MAVDAPMILEVSLRLTFGLRGNSQWCVFGLMQDAHPIWYRAFDDLDDALAFVRAIAEQQMPGIGVDFGNAPEPKVSSKELRTLFRMVEAFPPDDGLGDFPDPPI